MSGSVRMRVAALVALVLVAIVVLLPSLVSSLPSWWRWQQPIRLGLDLRGGTHLLYAVEMDQAVDGAVQRMSIELERELRDAQVGAATVDATGRRLGIRLANKDKLQDVRGLVKDRFQVLAEEPGAGVEGADLTLVFSEKAVLNVRNNAVEGALKVIRNRIDEFGVAEPTVTLQGADEIVVQLPGIQDPKRAKELIGRTAVLEFKIVATQEGPTTQALSGADEKGGRGRYVVEKRPIMTGDSLVDARIAQGGGLEGWAVDFTLDTRGTRLFGEATTKNVGRQLAIVLDNYVQSAPVIREAITGGRGQITGRFAFPEAQDLANVLRNGALPAPLKLLEERTVGPTLGKDSIQRGFTSMAAAGVGIVLFMLAYYRGGGLIANTALAMNALFLLAALAGFGATLTLPGLAGIVLTLGMAVDANVLILERVREELRLGKSPRAALDAGYERAWSAILDSNVTTFFAGVILFQFGTGPVRGFAVTLCIGIATTLLTAVFGTRAIYDTLASGRGLDRLSV